LSNFENTNGFKVIQQWMADKGNSPFKFQVDTWQKFENGYSGMVLLRPVSEKHFLFFSIVSLFKPS
jgi:ATP-dependent Lhr-like helicase